MKNSTSVSRLGVLVFIIFSAVLLFACAGQQAQSENQPTEPIVLDPPLDKAYKVVLIDNVSIDPDMEEDYREAINQCQQSAIWALQDKKHYQQVDRVQAGQTPSADTLITKITVTDMRMVSGGARFWIGAFAGSSYMNMEIDFIDAATQTVVRKKEISSSNNPFGAAWSGGSTDKSLPSDMGKIVAEYIDSIIPK